MNTNSCSVRVFGILRSIRPQFIFQCMDYKNNSIYAVHVYVRSKITYLVLSVRSISRSPITASNSACTLACTSWCLRSIKMTNDNMLLVVSEPAKNKSNNRTRSCSSVNEFGNSLLFSISVKNAHIKSSWSLCLCSSIDSYINLHGKHTYIYIYICCIYAYKTTVSVIITTHSILTFKNV